MVDVVYLPGLVSALRNDNAPQWHSHFSPKDLGSIESLFQNSHMIHYDIMDFSKMISLFQFKAFMYMSKPVGYVISVRVNFQLSILKKKKKKKKNAATRTSGVSCVNILIVIWFSCFKLVLKTSACHRFS
jgi:hypothetical protein